MSPKKPFTSSLSRAEVDLGFVVWSWPGLIYSHQCSFSSMTVQEVVRELTMPLFGAKWVYCGECAIERPAERLHRIGRAGGQRLYQPVNAAYLWEFMDEPGARMELEVRDT